MKHKGKGGLLINAPDELKDEFGEFGFHEKVEGNSNFTILFVKNKAEVDRYLLEVIEKAEYDSPFWIAYPKGTSKVKTDINRDILWAHLKTIGYRPVSMISMDKTWSAMRIRPSAEVKGK